MGVMLILSALSAGAICLGMGAFSGLDWLWLLPVCFVGSFLGLLLLLFLLALVMACLVDMEKVQEKDNPFYRVVTHWVIRIGFPLLRVRVHTQGLEKTPEEKRCMVVCNHLNELDPAFLMRAFPQKRLAFISKREVDRMFLIGPFLHKLLGQPINRENDREALKTILNCVRIIKEDKASIGVFPEGYINKEKKLYPLRNGVFKIAQKTGVPIVVCTLRNTQHIFSNIKQLKPTDVQLHLVGVIRPEEYGGLTAVQIGQQVYGMMARDLGPELVKQGEIPSGS